jgi:hypothetical protein
VPPFLEALLAKLESGEHEQIRPLVESRLPEPDSVHDPVAKRQFSHFVPRLGRFNRTAGAAPADDKKMTAAPRHHNSPIAGSWERRGAELVSRLSGSELKVGSRWLP